MRVAIMLASVAAYVLSIDILGMPISTFLVVSLRSGTWAAIAGTFPLLPGWCPQLSPTFSSGTDWA